MNLKIALFVFSFLFAPVAFAHEGHDADPAQEMTDAANALIKWLTPEQKKQAVLDFDADERENWHYVPFDRIEIKLSELSPAQDHYAYALLNTGLSQKGFMTATTIMSLEKILADKEKRPEFRDPEKYYVTIFGTPSQDGTWGWRFEGHHLSLNFTLANGQISVTPAFFGTNPAELREGPQAGIRPLGEIEDRARRLVESLGDAAVFSDKPPKDIVSSQDRKATMPGDEGVVGADMSPEQREMLIGILEEFASNTRHQIQTRALERIRGSVGKLRFAWAGSTKVGEKHYFRIVMPDAYLVEYANTQNQANHAHAVWRVFAGDFGRDLLRDHLSDGH